MDLDNLQIGLLIIQASLVVAHVGVCIIFNSIIEKGKSLLQETREEAIAMAEMLERRIL